MYRLTQAFVLLCGLYLNEAGYGSNVGYGAPEVQSDVEAPSYVPAYLKNQRFTKTNYVGTKTAYSGTKTAYSRTKTSYSGTKNPSRPTPSRYSESKTWYTNTNQVPNYEVFINNANLPFQPKCVPECKNSGICVDTNTCQCPSNFQGQYCEFEKKPCLTYPPLPKNGVLKCSTEQCTITCETGYKFIDGSSVANMRCVNGEWQPSRADFTTIPDCLAQCEPPCASGGVCLAMNTCSCPSAYRGPQCQYSVSACDVSQLSFNGGYKCAGDGEKYSCKLSCPPGATWSSPPAAMYSCLYSTGVFHPQPIPHCVFPDVVLIKPSQNYNSTYYSFSQTQYGSNSSTFGGSSQGGYGQEGYGQGGYSQGGFGHGGYGHTVKVEVQDLTPRGGTCLTWAGAHYKTFDGKIYTFRSPCQHMLLGDPKDHKYTIAIQQKPCKRPSYCPSELTIYLEEKPYTLATEEDGTVIFRSTKRLIPIPASLPGMRVSMPSDYVMINLDAAGVTIKWDTNTLVQIDGSVLLWNKTEGLCGTLDGNPENDLKTKTGQVVQSVSVLASSWQINKIGADVCDTSPMETSACASSTSADVKAAAKFCTDMISMKKFRKCSKVMEVLQFIETCKWDYCACAATSNSEECACRAISVYAKECLRHGVKEMKNWRDPVTCPMQCPDGKLYKSCGSDSQPSCAFPLLAAKVDSSTCVEGCFCPPGLLLEAGKCVPPQECPCRLRNKVFPPGSVINKDCNTCTCQSGEWTCTAAACGARCRAVGDPHYTTFDGLRYDFMGRCSYTMLQTDNVTVEVENVACSGAISEEMNLTPMKSAGKPSCTKAVTIKYGGVSIHLSQGGSVTVNGKEVTAIPVMAGDVRIRAASSLFLIVQLPNKVDLWWDGNTRVFIDVPANFKGKTKGLCGTFNLNQKDDFLTPENDVEQSTTAFANKWRTRELCDDSNAPEPEHPCQANMENKEAAEQYCSKLKSMIFEECHWHVDVEPYYESCLYDMCACEGDVSRCLCPTLGDYATSCARAGVKLQWRYHVSECELSCTGGQEYTVCADSCLRKCGDSALAGFCTPSCVEGCACPTGELLDDNGVCVPIALCPCTHKGLQFPAGYKEVRPGKRERELCACVGARWDCKPATPEEIKQFPPAEDLRSNCSATDNMEFTTCAVEPLTCKNMHLRPTAMAAECRPGCQCRRGFVLDAGSGRCVLPEACPCHHGGRSYPDGHVMAEHCNTCECNRGKWTCTSKQCAGVCGAWGDSHISTFDGNDYDFEGVCTYLLAKGNMDGHDGFDVEIQNVPCGTTGATCSKSVTLKVGRGDSTEVVSLTKDAPLPDVSKLKRIKLREGGAYVFLDVPALGVGVQWDRQLRAYVKLQPMWRGRVKGLCGNYNGDMRDDYQTPSGGLAEASALIFADSWRLKPTCPKAREVPDHCKERPHRKDWSTSTCGVLKRYPFTLCHSEVPVNTWVQRCERDACACDAGGDCVCACAALAAYAHVCASRGVVFNWRTHELCPMQCDEECSNYDGCVSPCPAESCDNTLNYKDIRITCEKDHCVEGCKPKKPCAEGQVYKNSSTTECVPRAQCKPPCMTLDNGTEVAEGGLVSEDACHTCTCSKSHVVCSGQPCTTVVPIISPKPHDEPLKCRSGWSQWLSQNTPEIDADGYTVETEPLPQHNELPIGSPMCKPENMTDIECRTTDTHQTAKETGLNVECSLERGLFCKEKGVLCPDFEIRVLCTCEEPNPCENTTAPNWQHPTDCAKFYECSPSGPVLKDCGSGTLYNPKTFVCDWPAAVAAVRPECGSTTPGAIPTSTVPPTTVPPTTVPTSTVQLTTVPTSTVVSTKAVCPPGQEYRACAYPCDQMCDHYKRTLMTELRCIKEKCVEGCVNASLACPRGHYWRDERTCVRKQDCTCFSDGQIVKPGGFIIDGCLKCQCLDNDFHCDTTECVFDKVPTSGSTHENYIFTTPAMTTQFIPETTTLKTSTVPSTSTVLPTSTVPSTSAVPSTSTFLPSTRTSTITSSPVPSTSPITTMLPTEEEKNLKEKEEIIPDYISTEAPIIVKSTSTPPPKCDPDNYMDLMWGDEPLPESSITASSTLDELHKPHNAELDARPLDTTDGEWSPAVNNANQYIQVQLPSKQPVVGVKLQGSPILDQYVTSYVVLYGDDGVVFSTVEEPDGKPKVFRGPVNHDEISRQMIRPPIEARYVRIQPQTWHNKISVRMELIGCSEPSTTVPPTSTTVIVTTTEAPQCTEPLGLAADLPLSSITTSSNPEDKQYLALDGDRGWRPLYSSPGEWIMFNFTSPRNITGLKTKGGKKGWVTTFKVLHSNDLDTFSPVVDKNKKERTFPANYDKKSVMEHAFRPPIRAQFLKVMPLTWKDNLEIKIEPIGCFEPYPTVPPTPATPATPPPCQMCPGVLAVTCACTDDLYYDGEMCVNRTQCPCVISIMSYPVGQSFRGDKCDECVCKLGGVTHCKPPRECDCMDANIPAPYPDRTQLVGKLDPETCECACAPCPPRTKKCGDGLCLALNRWCDGVADCSDDELNCATEPTIATEKEVTVAATPSTAAVTTPSTTIASTAAPSVCPPVQCPPGYQAVLTSRARNPWVSTDLPPPRPRHSYARYIKGGYTKGGYSGTKGGFSKGGFSKGGFVPPPQPTSEAFTLDKPLFPTTPAPAGEPPVCPQFKCVPRVPPFPKPGSTPAPVVCSVVSCPSGYTLKLETLADGFSKCPQYECVPPPERPAYCNVTGRTFNTFDGTEYKYDVCDHILARDNRFDSWTVLLRKKCREESCWNELLVHQDDQLILVRPDLMIEYNNYVYTVEQTARICFQKNSFDIARLGRGVSIKSRKYNFTVMFSKDGDVKVGVLNSLKGKVDGMCGFFDGSPLTDRQLPTGQRANSIEQFGRAWSRKDPDSCRPKIVSDRKQRRVWDACKVIKEEPLAQCAAVLNLDKWRSICLEKVCECSDLIVNGTKRSEEECRCLVLEHLVAECLAAAPELHLDNWRMMMDCPVECPAPLVHYDCYRRRCEPECGGGAEACGVVGGLCAPGCYCPPGTLRRGAACVPPAQCLDCTCNGVGSPAKYVTFEGDDLPYLGNCTYVASQDRSPDGQHLYQLFATNGPCENKPSVSCVKALHLIYANNVIHVTKDLKTKKLVTTIGETPVFKYPLKKEWGTISLDNGQDITISLPDIHLELTVLQTKLEFTVRLPSFVYANQTEGLCGVCSGDLELLLTSNGTQTGNFDEYGKSWQAPPSALSALGVPPQEQCDQPPPPAPCTPPPPETNPCYSLYNADRFGECHALVDPAPFLESCEADLCDNVTDVCGTLERYAAACRRQGVCLNKWRTDVCPYPCDAPLVYRPCVACELTCENNDALTANPEKCRVKQPVEGCFCPEGKVRVNNTCIEPQKCFPCDANKEHYAGDQWQENACTTCTCSKVHGENKAAVSCTTQSCTRPVCAEREDLVVQRADPTACCDTYVCVPKPKVAECVEPKKMKCGFGQILKQKLTADGCPEFVCECKPASECETIPSESEVEMLEEGVERVIDNSGCCPKVDLVCRKEKCPSPPACPQFHELSVRNVSGKCCPQYECELPQDKCLVKLEWESSPLGGEKRRKLPETLFKEIGESWADGPCRTCECVQAGAAPAPRCTKASCQAPPRDPAFVLKPRPVPFACCPDVEYVACRDGDNVYEVGQNWTSPTDVCTVYKCVESNGKLERVNTVQNCEKNCQPGWVYTPAAAGSEQCCGKCRPVACVVGGQQRPIGDKWTSADFCTNYTCVDVNGTLQVQTANETCPTISDALKKQFVLKDEKVPGKCCADQEPVACRVGNKIYQEGQTWPSSDPCRNVSCARDETGRLSHTSHVTSCNTACPLGWRYKPSDSECCGRCVQDKCVVGELVAEPGTTWQSSDNCTTFSCERSGEEVFVTSSRQLCPDVSKCAPAHLVNESCCTVCRPPSADHSKCAPQALPSHLTVGLFHAHFGAVQCVNKEPVKGFSECRGSCDSGAFFDAVIGVHKSVCECCTVRNLTSVDVPLSCSDGSSRLHRVASPTHCYCTACGNGYSTKTPGHGTKTPGYGTKNPPPPKPAKIQEEDTDFIPEIFQRFGEST